MRTGHVVLAGQNSKLHTNAPTCRAGMRDVRQSGHSVVVPLGRSWREARHIKRLMRARDDDAAAGIRRFGFMADYGGSPIWRAHNAGRVWPEELGLSDDLCRRIRRWAAAYEDADVAYDAVEWERDGPLLAAEIAAELGPGAIVEYRG